jgi:hypothetical protein
VCGDGTAMYAYVYVCMRLLSLVICDVGRGGWGYVVWIRRCVNGRKERPYCSFFIAELPLCVTTPILESGAWTSRRGVWGME